MEEPDSGVEAEEVEYRERIARKRQIIGAFLLALFIGLPGTGLFLLHFVWA